jgi:hypothetical protein
LVIATSSITRGTLNTLAQAELRPLDSLAGLATFGARMGKLEALPLAFE